MGKSIPLPLSLPSPSPLSLSILALPPACLLAERVTPTERATPHPPLPLLSPLSSPLSPLPSPLSPLPSPLSPLPSPPSPLPPPRITAAEQVAVNP